MGFARPDVSYALPIPPTRFGDILSRSRLACATMSTMRIHVLCLLALGCWMPASGSTIEMFEIINSSSLSVSGGVFTSGGGGTLSGTFEVDASQIPPDGSRTDFPLTSWDIFVRGAVQPFNIEFNPSNGNGSFIAQTEQNLTNLGFPNYGLAQVDSVLFQRIVGEDVYQLTLSMIEPAGLFHGGVVLEASDTLTGFGSPPFQTSLSDAFGTGLIVDPAVLAPEPGCGLLLAAGLSLCGLVRLRFTN